MDGNNIREGLVYSLTFFEGDKLLCGLVVEKLDSHSVNVSLFRDRAGQVETALDLLDACQTVLHSQSRLSRMERLIDNGGDAFEDDEDKEGTDSPSPIDISDIPF